ncbi:unnamed protein product, partial [Ixodes hexagonus]
MRQASFSWHRDQRHVLKDLNLHVPQGKLVAVVGPVGAGKTSLLSAILGEMRCVQGSIDRKAKRQLAYVAQQAWIQNATLQQNVLLKRSLRPCFYQRVVQACQLQADLDGLPAGDQTEIGGRGANLSGGQRQRINLARAVYQNADVYVMDDPLSAVDAQVGAALFHGVIGRRGLLRNKVFSLIFHKLNALPSRTHVITTKPLRDKRRLLFPGDVAIAVLLQSYTSTPPLNSTPHIMASRKRRPLILSCTPHRVMTITTSRPSLIFRPSLSLPPSRTHLSHIPHDPHGLTALINLFDFVYFLRSAMQSLCSQMDPKVYRDYVQRFGPVMVFGMLGGYGLCRAFDMLSSVWISNWSQDAASGEGNTAQRNWRLAIYAIFGICQGLAIWAGTLVMGLRTLEASRSLHESILYRVVRAPMWFFDTTPLGRILNRFGKDLDQADSHLPMMTDAVLEQLTDVIGVGVLITIYVPLFMLAILPSALLYLVIQKTYVRTSRQLQRLESVSRSPVYNCVSETVPGVQTIRAYGVQRPFEGLSDALLERWVACSFYLMCADRWLTLRLNLLSTAITLFTAVLVVRGRETIGPAAAGLTLLYALKVRRCSLWRVLLNAPLVNHRDPSMHCKRTQTLTMSQAPWRVTPAPSPDWPSRGAVRFVGFSTRYRPELDLVLKNLNLNIDASEKVGIVGRTGSGKSSLTLSLFRILEATKGDIFIDNVAISALGLHDLRSKLTIIAQEPVLFSGTLRTNLDPKAEYTDEQVWTALEKAHLKRFFQSKPGNLSFHVEEEGQNLSVGQHQLICLARALLRDTKVLILDEATASIDPDTDVLVQRTIRQDFGHCTVITIAHRLQTIMDVNR